MGPHCWDTLASLGRCSGRRGGQAGALAPQPGSAGTAAWQRCRGWCRATVLGGCGDAEPCSGSCCSPGIRSRAECNWMASRGRMVPCGLGTAVPAAGNMPMAPWPGNATVAGDVPPLTPAPRIGAGSWTCCPCISHVSSPPMGARERPTAPQKPHILGKMGHIWLEQEALAQRKSLDTSPSPNCPPFLRSHRWRPGVKNC